MVHTFSLKLFKAFLASLLFLFVFENTFAQQNVEPVADSAPVLKRRSVDIDSDQAEVKNGCGETGGYWVCGRVIDANGNPVSGISVEVTSAYYQTGSPLYYSCVGFTDKDGYFKGLHYTAKPDAYVVSINYIYKPGDDYPFPTTFYPAAKTKNEATVFRMSSEENISGIVFQLPPRMVKKEILLTISYEDGSPAEEVTASLENHEHSNNYENHGWITDENGFVEMSVFEDKGYQIKVDGKRVTDGKEVDYYAESEIFDLGNKNLNIKLILKPQTR
jgi:hypothetical protein